jgi:hypothetical protein
VEVATDVVVVSVLAMVVVVVAVEAAVVVGVVAVAAVVVGVVVVVVHAVLPLAHAINCTIAVPFVISGLANAWLGSDEHSLTTVL